MKHLLVCVIALCGFTKHLTAQIASAPDRESEHLMIGPAAFLRSPNPFPITLPATASALDTSMARRLAPRDWAMAHALPCRAVSLANTREWVPITNGSDPGPALMPRAFAQDTAFRSYHGGLRWIAPSSSFSVENGWWGVLYDSAGYLTGCRVTVRAGDYLVSERRISDGFEFTAIPWNPTWGPSTKITAHASTETQLRILWTAFVGMVPPECQYRTGEPVRNPSSSAC